MNALAIEQQRRWLVPEVVQTSAMDCGPAALKCLLEGFKIPVSYGRLREACQTSVDGTSIDRLEEVANQLGIKAEQMMLPVDHLFLPDVSLLPALIVSRHADGATHFVVIWRQHGPWLQLMDPAMGRRWVSRRQFASEIFRHSHAVAAQDWRDWAGSGEAGMLFKQRVRLLGINEHDGVGLINAAAQDAEWFSFAKLDAGLRLVQSLIDAKGIKASKQALSLLKTLLAQIDKEDIYRSIPLTYWSVTPQQSAADDEKMLLLKGAVLLQVQGRPAEKPVEDTEPLSVELQAALSESPLQPLRTVIDLLKTDGVVSPLALLAAVILSAAAVLLETLLFRGIFDIAWDLRSVEQRVLAMLGLLIFVSALLLIEIPIVQESLRFGRHLETRFRMALLRKLPRLNDRYFQSRPISDMAERGHGIALTRSLPGLGVQFVQALWDLLFTLIGILLIDPHSALPAILIAIIAVGLPLLAQPMINERDLRMRSHAGALFRFYLDALIGLVPIRAHSAEPAVRREHEGLLVEWMRAGRGLVRLALLSEGVQSLLCISLAGGLLFEHFSRSGSIMGGDLLLVYWVLKLPAIGQHLTTLAHQYPAQRNSLLRLLEPLSAPVDTPATAEHAPQSVVELSPAASIEIKAGDVTAAGHLLLSNINLNIRAGEHIAIVGPSGSGKSSLLGILLGWHKLAHGTLTTDGLPLSELQLQTLRQTTAWVDPAIQIWNRSFLDNVTFSTANYELDSLGAVLDTAALRGVLQKLPNGLQTYLGEGGGLLSGGEGQRLRLARALLQSQVRLALLDEPFRGVDRQQRRQLLADARRWWQAVTLLCVTHDIEETQAFDRVLVIEDGQIIEDDTPSRLLQRDSRYRALLHAENHVREQFWQDRRWRRIEIAAGKAIACHEVLDV
jgi:ABC-type bacteriocin/lantibiotic exporter with double-glycine peptidase domain